MSRIKFLNAFQNLEDWDYQAQLERPEWQKKRNEILDRDNYRCQICGKGRSQCIKIKDQYWNIGIDYNGYSNNEILSTTLSISEFKSLVHTDTIFTVKSDLLCKKNSNWIVAISNNGVLGIMENIQQPLPPDNFQINLIKYSSGLLSFMIIKKDSRSDSQNIGNAVYMSPGPICLNVHHKRYIIQYKAWEYNNEDLVTLCNECHLKIHQAIGVKIYSDENGYMRQIPLTPCTRCNGAGYFPEYKHINSGTCFRCRGARFEELIQSHQ